MDTASYRVVASLKAGGVVLDKPEWIQQAIGLWPRSRLVGLYWINLNGYSKL